MPYMQAQVAGALPGPQAQPVLMVCRGYKAL